MQELRCRDVGGDCGQCSVCVVCLWNLHGCSWVDRVQELRCGHVLARASVELHDVRCGHLPAALRRERLRDMLVCDERGSDELRDHDRLRRGHVLVGLRLCVVLSWHVLGRAGPGSVHLMPSRLLRRGLGRDELLRLLGRDLR